MKNPAREKFLPLLSPYVDGELSPEERRQVEQHLANNSEAARQVADLRAGDALMRHALEMASDDVDWKGFTEGVLSRLAPERLPWRERVWLRLTETWAWQRTSMVAGLAGAAAAVAVAVPLSIKFSTPDGYGAARVRIEAVALEGDTQATVNPLVMETEAGDAVIWMVDAPAAPAGAPKAAGAPAPSERRPDPVPPAGKGEL